MADIFLKIVNMSISASWIVLAVLVLRLLLKKAPKWITVLLWGIVAIRLICPFSIESVMSLIPSTETISPEIMMDKTPTINSGVPIINNIVNPVIGESFAPDPIASANPLQILIPVLAIAWAAGIIVMLAYTAISYFRVKSKIGTAVLFRDNIYQSENVVSPFVLGIIKPKIYLPFNMNEQDMAHVIAHENAHIRRKDHWWKPFGFLVLTLHWFNPLMWLGYVLLCRDIELACDEKVVKEFNNEQKADYSQALLTCSVSRRIIAACPLAFGEVGVKNRVKSVLNYKKPAFWIVATAIVASIVVAICFLTNPASNKLKNIENSSSIPTSEETVVWVSDGATYQAIGTVGTDLLEELSEIKISSKEISLSRDENRDKSHTLVLQTKEDAAPTIYSYLSGLYIHFNADFTSVWVNDGVKPTFSYKVIDPKNAKVIYENIANYVGPEKLTWTYQPMLSFTGHSFKAISFDFDYTHVEATCTGGEFCSLDVDGQPCDTKMHFEKDNTVYWTPKEAVIEKIPQNSELTLEIYNDKTQVHKCIIVFECVSRDIAKAEFEIYLKDSDGLKMIYDNGIKLVEQGSVSNIGGADVPKNVITSADIEQLKTKYPQFFNVSTDGGLTVYIWQMSKDNYSCYLANTSMEAISDNSFAYDVGATIAEMRAILTTYDIDRKDITVQPVINPLSSYYYEIDDAYRAKVKGLFWKYSYNVIDYDGSSIPKLNVTCGNASTEASIGTTEWTYDNGDGTMQTVNGDSSHPLERIDYLLPLALKVNRSNNATPVVRLNFDVAPDSIKVNSWLLTEKGKTKSFDAEVDGFNIRLNAGKETCIYEAVATWNKSTKYYGTVRYSFCVVKNTELNSSPSNKVYDASLSFANWTDDSKIYTSSLNLSKMQSNSIQHLPIYKFDSLKDLKQFKESFGDILTMDNGWDEVPSFNEATAKYNAKFFEDNCLMLVYVSASNSTHRFGLGSIGWDEKSFCINVVETTDKEFVDAAMAGWFLTVAVEKETIASCTEFDADLNNEIKLY